MKINSLCTNEKVLSCKKVRKGIDRLDKAKDLK